MESNPNPIRNEKITYNNMRDNLNIFTCKTILFCYLKAFRDLVRKQKIYLKVRTPYIQSKLTEWQHLPKENTLNLSKRFTPLGVNQIVI